MGISTEETKDKLEKYVVGYFDPFRDSKGNPIEFECETCRYFIPPESGDVGDCQLIKGAVHKEGCCSIWTLNPQATGEFEAGQEMRPILTIGNQIQDQGLPIGSEEKEQGVNPETLPDPPKE